MLIEVFRDFKKHHEMVKYMPLDESNYYGPEQTRGATAYPYIKWIPTSDTWTTEGPLWVTKNAIIDGKAVQMEACFSRGCGVDIYLYEQNYFKLETMINAVGNALYDVLQSTGNFRLPTGRMLNREDVTEDSVGYVINTTIFVPIYRTLPLATVHTTQENFITTPPS